MFWTYHERTRNIHVSISSNFKPHSYNSEQIDSTIHTPGNISADSTIHTPGNNSAGHKFQRLFNSCIYALIWKNWNFSVATGWWDNEINAVPMYHDHLLVVAYDQSIRIMASTMEIRPVMKVTVPSTLRILFQSPGEQQTNKKDSHIPLHSSTETQHSTERT